MNIPILMNHDQTKPIGFVEVIDGALHVRFAEDVRITRDMAFQIFGDAGLQVLEATDEAGVMLIRHGRILEWSLCPQPAMPNVLVTGRGTHDPGRDTAVRAPVGL